MIQHVPSEPISGIRIGHAQDDVARTGCTVILCEEGARAGFDVRGSAPGTRETDLLRPGFLVEKIQGVLLTGGSAFGLDAAGGVQQYLEQRGKGHDAQGVKVPIVPAAVIFDLHIGSHQRRPDKSMGYLACENANPDKVDCGVTGAGTGATVGKILGMNSSMLGGIGYSSDKLSSGIIVSAIVVVNALGDVIDPDKNKIIVGAKDPHKGTWIDTVQLMRQKQVEFSKETNNTTLGVVMTNVDLDKVQINKVAQMAQNGIARTIRPSHTMFDGDLIFSLSYGNMSGDVNLVGEIAARCVARAIVMAVKVSNGLR